MARLEAASVTLARFSSMLARKVRACSTTSSRTWRFSASPLARRAAKTSARRASCIMSASPWVLVCVPVATTE